MASSSWCKETDGKINYTKLCRLLVDGGAHAVRSVFDGIHPPSSLKANLKTNEKKLQNLRTKKKVLNKEQWDKLYPPSGSDPKSEDFDITLLFVLLRNICGLTPPATGWDVLPPGTDNSREANLARIKYHRNKTIAHKPKTEINDVDFAQYWQDISSALVSLGLSQDDIDDLKSAPLGEKDYKQLLYEWHISETQKRNQETHKLHFSDFRPEINIKCKSFHPNTRQWILDQVKSHVDSDQPHSCIMLITAGPGMGKSTIAAKICQTYKDLGRLAACHFFQFSNSTRNNPRLMLQSIARQMCDTVPGYQEALESKLQTDLGKKISEMNCEELLTILLEEPLCNVEQTDTNLVIVLDALDKCSHDPKDKLLRALKEKLSCFPSWLRFIVTSRPSRNTSALGSTVDVKIKAEDPPNTKDLELFFNCKLKDLFPRYSMYQNGDLVLNLVEMSKGLFLLAFFVIDLLKRQNLESPEKVLELFPNGISSVYENYFSRLKEALLPYIADKNGFYKMLEAVVATKHPLPKKMFYHILCVKSEDEVPRQERKTRKDALISLHWLFPVEGDHVAPYHKSVFDWLTLEGDEEHDFSVRVEDGDEILASQCNEALRDLRDGKKDLDKPLNLADSEKYALRFLNHLVRKGSPVASADKYGFFSNIFFLAALGMFEGIEGIVHHKDVSEGIKCRSLREAFRRMSSCLSVGSLHYPSCRFSLPISFGSYLAFLLEVAHYKGVSGEATPDPLDALKKHGFPYCHKRNNLLQIPFEESLRYILQCKKGIILSLYCSNSLSTAVHVFQRDGCLVTRKSFLGEWLLATSPNINFIVAAEKQGNKIEILDSTTLEVVSQYRSPHNAIETCHVFGDDQGWFIVIKGCHDNKVYVIEGLTGQVRNTVTVKEGSTLVGVSRQGHIVVSRIWESDEPEEITFTNKDGEVELMNWKSLDNKYPCYREMFLCHSDGQEHIPIYPLAEKICSCNDYYCPPYGDVDGEVHFSEDGRLLAYLYKDSIFIVNTSDGSLFKRCSFDLPFGDFDILFVSGSYLVITDKSTMYVINVQTDEIEHRIYLPYPVLPNENQYLLFPEEDGKSFNLIIINNWKPSVCEVLRLVFHNLNLQGFQ